MRCGFWNLMVASHSGRWLRILLQFATIQVAAFAGTKQQKPLFLQPFATNFYEKIQGRAGAVLDNLDTRLRAVEDIIQDGLDVPICLEDIKAALRAGSNYQASVDEQGKGSRFRSPHTYVFSDLCRTMAVDPNCFKELVALLKEFSMNNTSSNQASHPVLHCPERCSATYVEPDAAFSLTE